MKWSFAPKIQLAGNGLRPIGEDLIGVKADFLPGVAPLAHSPVVVGERDAKSCIANPIHETQPPHRRPLRRDCDA
jgi:hypothetical protein